MWGAISDHYVAKNYLATILATGPLVFYRLGELAAASTMADSSGNARHGTYQGSGHTKEIAGMSGDGNTAVNFNGSTAYATSPNSTWYHTNFVTAQAFIRPDVTPAAVTFIVANDIGNFTGSNLRRWQLRTTAAGKAEFVFWAADGGTNNNVTGTTTLTAGNVYRIWGTYDGSVGRLYVGVNGATPTLENSVSAAGALPVIVGGNSNPITLARNSSTSGNFFDGTIDEVAVWDNPLSLSTITDINAAAA